jgi:hypothetical protein
MWVGLLVCHDVTVAEGNDNQPPLAGKTQIVLLLCHLTASFDGFLVQVYSHSGGAPSIQTGTDCAQGLASVLSAGYRIRDVQVLQNTDILYTLIDR